ncbi:RdgB/HAM1 family non-canonical purine NTP pyrophosphatase [Geitlerinema sp. P-1104]|uniref:RdgB/HAM1 family non-canonical purine NTP pyrophosphatase n=1 Tax=Geitlerinema sp. P-1104 TaxID=2546230 RepID=UPI0014772443|nr:RdgB/HAM1 family non-canonical purine NTP pyrophosphatase [Geitlerinema sp. P-1104]NMG58710.1 RdgB/HAM1 family non-canonical purine NTP pyrophosphatase [Geitlerinema sp. P-1104]
MTILIVATGNPGKLKEMQEYLEETHWDLQLKPKDLDIEETGTTFAENARLKAVTVAQATGQWAIADDSGLAVDALDGRPGIYSARYGANDGDRIQRLLTELGETGDRRAQFICAIALANPQGAIALEVQGCCPGEILEAPRGQGGFGYDPIFWVRQQQQTFAEMAPKTKKACSHRGVAFKQLLPKLAQLQP